MSAAISSDDLLRITVTGADRRVDLALPVALPVVELVPGLAREIGVLDGETAYAGYWLTTADGRRLSPDLGLSAQGVEPGDVLTLVVGADERPERVYDDVIEAMADAVEAETRSWSPESGRRTALGAATVLLSMGALALALQRPDVVAGTLGLVAAAVLLTAAVTLSRVQHEHDAALTLAWAGCGFAAVGALTIVQDADVLRLPMLVAGAALALAGAAAVLGLEQHRLLLLPAAATGIVVAAAAGIATASTYAPAAVYTVALVVVALAGSLLPWLALGSTSTRVEQAQEDSDITADPDPIDPDAVRRDAGLAHGVLVAVTATVGVVVTLVAPLAVGLGITGALVVVCVSVVLMLRTRQYRSRVEVGTGLAGGLAGLTSTVVSIVVLQPEWRSSIALVLAVTGTVLLLLTLVPRGPSLRQGRLGDVAEVAALIALLPLTVIATGLVSAVSR